MSVKYRAPPQPVLLHTIMELNRCITRASSHSSLSVSQSVFHSCIRYQSEAIVKMLVRNVVKTFNEVLVRNVVMTFNDEVVSTYLCSAE